MTPRWPNRSDASSLALLDIPVDMSCAHLRMTSSGRRTRGNGISAISPASKPVPTSPPGTPSVLPWEPKPGTRDAADQALADPLQPPAKNGWSPATITPIESQNRHGFAGAALKLALGGVDEVPGQRLSTAQVDALAPYLAQTYGLDEQYTRDQLAQVYLYVGGPAVDGQAMTIGHHIFMPDNDSLHQILSPKGKRWLTHELSHTMQFLSRDDSSPHRFLADYLKGMLIGRNPRGAGEGAGGPVWGALFTGAQVTGKNAAELGKRSESAPDRLGMSVIPALAIGVPLTAAVTGALAATRLTTRLPVLGTAHALPTAAALIALPALIGAGAGAAGNHISKRTAQVTSAVAGGGIAAAMLWHAGAFTGHLPAAAEAAAKLGPITRALGSSGGIALGIGAVAGAALIGWGSATASANSIAGWSTSAKTLTQLRKDDTDPESKLTFSKGLHDAHWMELDAETSAQRYMSGDWTPPEDEKPVAGRIPPSGLRRDGTMEIRDQIDWGITNPLILGIPAAAAVGTGVLAARTAKTLISTPLKEGGGIGKALGTTLRDLGTSGRGIGNSLGVGAALTLAPLVMGGLSGPIIDDLTGSTTTARFGGAAVSAAGTGVLLPMLLRRAGAGNKFTIGATIAGMAVSAGVGMLSAGLATDAARRTPDRYDVTK